MSAFDLLHPAVRHHIVNSMGWRELRPLQEASISPVLAGSHALLLAPTAGGKTEAAFFPLLSRMLAESWAGLSVLYVCPIKALLNNLEARLGRYCELVGRRCALWHGDISTAVRGRIVADTPDVLLTTPESLEVMLISRRSEKGRLFCDVRVVVVDELHAFAGDDRGWHLLSVLERVTRIAGRELQRIGLSATVGNPEALLGWLSGSCTGEREVIAPHAPAASEADVEVDYVGSVANAAIVVSRLHRGEKRLVFCDSRARAEELAARLRGLEVETYVSHSSLSAGERRRAEEAFATGSDCVVVATSTLELGIDVGDLDRVIQLDAPFTVSSFLQRMGRTGRRPGASRNCLFLATARETLLRAAGLVRLCERGFVEPVAPPAEPYHVFAQQIMALALQEQGLGDSAWRDWIGRVPAFASMSEERKREVLGFMREAGILFDDGGLLWLGLEGEARYGRKNFLELFSVFYSPPLFKVRHGRNDIGEVHESTFMTRSAAAPVLTLGGKSWKVTHVEWRKRVAYVEPADEPGRSRWIGFAQPLSFELCRAIREVLVAEEASPAWSRRAADEIREARCDLPWLSADETTLVASGDSAVWYTFAGIRANAMLAERLEERAAGRVGFDNFRVRIDGPLDRSAVADRVKEIGLQAPDLGPRRGIEDAVTGLKFSSCLPRNVAEEMLRVRNADPRAVEMVLSEPLHVVDVAPRKLT